MEWFEKKYGINILNPKTKQESDSSSSDESEEDDQIDQPIHSNINNASSALEDESDDESFSNFSNGHVSVGLISGGGIKSLEKKTKSIVEVSKDAGLSKKHSTLTSK